MELAAVLTPAEEGGYVALNPEAGTTIQGGTVEGGNCQPDRGDGTLFVQVSPRAPGHPLVTMFSVPEHA